MGYSKEAYDYALKTVMTRHEEALDKAEARKNEIYLAVPQLAEIDSKLTATGLSAVKAASAFDGTQKLTELRAVYSLLEDQRQALMKSCGLSDADFEPKFTCPICGDSGYSEGCLCRCAKALAKQYEYDRLNRSMPLEQSTFDRFDLSYYMGSDRASMEQTLRFCRDYATNFRTSAPSLLFYGKTGLGKTHLSLAIANEVLNAGFGVMYSSVQNYLERLEKEHFGRSEGDTMELLTGCDLLILDDLGAEFQTAFTVSAIYNILNSRILNGLPTVISTNLTPAEITGIYGERVMSRILGSFRRFEFSGADIRQQKMLRGNND